MKMEGGSRSEQGRRGRMGVPGRGGTLLHQPSRC